MSNYISIHTTRVGGDGIKQVMQQIRQISIHTTRVGGDGYKASNATDTANFNPHHPCGW